MGARTPRVFLDAVLPHLKGPSPCDNCEFLPACAQRADDGKSIYACLDFVEFTHSGKVQRLQRSPTREIANYLEERTGYRKDYERSHQKRRLEKAA